MYGQLTAGHETTTALLSSGLKELLGQPEAWEAICRDRDLIPVAVEELLRVSAPVFTWKRRIKAPAQVGGVDLPAGTKLLLLLGSANHDDAVFENPDRIDLERENASRHLSFGLGIHFCLGAPLARLEGRVVLEELSARLPTLRLVAGQRFDYGANTSFRGPSHLLVQWDTVAPYTVTFERGTTDDIDGLGGKGASLVSLSAAGLPVPPGFVVTTAAFDAARAVDGVQARIARALARLDSGDVPALEATGATVRAMLEQVALPAGLAESIRTGYRSLCGEGADVPVAVRSSATAEDSALASFAGQQDTYLWIVGEDAVLEHVQRCWASLYSARSIAYRRHHATPEDDVRMAVVVQRMVGRARGRGGDDA